ncbi:substrate-binding domain-containing protein [candidate division KSB3 bacterium]|uniref:Substrate-binding domain-containing protein n=1 Tax=candidate division KSB3 bacterium TaxID=2044937 RepID=A0A9D5JX24_9BACT|nr:substrate-binding domain-containing protein [candidate division KSB3 bacterium]MBD3325713.1 substrate-binding domain-containing protein [candidate division KSB3 bacterium]
MCVISAFGWPGTGEAQDKGLVFYLSPNQFDEFQTTASMLMGKYVQEAGYEYRELVAGNEDVSLQLNQLENAITQNPKAIIIAAVDGTAVVDGVEQARSAGIPVIAFDRIISETELDFTSVAGCKRMGILAAGEAARLLEKKYGEPKGAILDIMGDPGDSYTVLIEEGFQEAMEQYPNIQIETKIADGWEASNAADIADDYLIAFPDTDIIFGHADHLGAAIVSVLETKGYDKGEIIVLSTAGMPMGLQLVREGWVQATVEQPLAAQAEGVAMFLEEVIAGEDIEPGTYTVGGFESELVEQPYGPELRIPGSVITQENVDDPKFWGNQVGE